MATPFIIKRGLEASLPDTYTSGTMYFCTDTGNIYIDYPEENGVIVRQQVAKDALDSKQNKIEGAASSVTTDNLTESHVLISNTSGKIAASELITTSELECLDGVTGNIQTQINEKSNRSIKTSATLSASSWNTSTKTYTYSNTNITTTSVVELIPSVSITETQYEALQDAQIIGTTQNSGSITLKAMGTIPTINIPVIFIIRGDL